MRYWKVVKALTDALENLDNGFKFGSKGAGDNSGGYYFIKGVEIDNDEINPELYGQARGVSLTVSDINIMLTFVNRSGSDKIDDAQKFDEDIQEILRLMWQDKVIRKYYLVSMDTAETDSDEDLKLSTFDFKYNMIIHNV